jgi:hypothetical protein
MRHLSAVGGRCAGQNHEDVMLKMGGRRVPGGQGRLTRREGGRQRLVKVRLDDDEAGKLEGLAAAAGVSAPRFLLEAALRGDGQMVVHRHQFYEELLRVRRLFILAGNNLNQLAHHANATGDTPSAAVLLAVAGEMETLAGEVAAKAAPLAWSVDPDGWSGGDGR